MSPGTSTAASCSPHLPSRRTCITNSSRLKPTREFQHVSHTQIETKGSLNHFLNKRYRNKPKLAKSKKQYFAAEHVVNSDTLALGARRAMSAAAALPALFSSMKLIVELMKSRTIIPTKSCQSGGFPCRNLRCPSINSQPTKILKEIAPITRKADDSRLH